MGKSGQISDLISKVLGQQSSGPASQNSKRGAAKDRRTAREASLCLDSLRIHQQSREGTGRWRRRALRTAAGTGVQPSSRGVRALELVHQCGVCRGGGRASGTGAERDEGARRFAPMSAPGPTGERREHLDAIVSFAGAGQRRRLFRVLTFSLAGRVPLPALIHN